MGRPSNKLRSAQRLGQRERARVKKSRRGITYGSVPSAGTYTLKAGRKKWQEFYRSRSNPFSHRFERKTAYGETADHVLHGPSIGEPISKVGN